MASYTREDKDNILNSIFDAITQGQAVRNAIKKENISFSTFYIWLDDDEDKAKQYARATEIRAEAMAEDILEICDAFENDIMLDQDGKEITNHNVIQRDRLRVDTRKWLMSKMMPKKYSDRQQIDHTTDGKSLNTPLMNLDPLKIKESK
jgi:Asp-tRNA(Asn)/Glu-tRNA(Gln) amidotransferase C subunit